MFSVSLLFASLGVRGGKRRDHKWGDYCVQLSLGWISGGVIALEKER